jgi:bile acid-coenzyme A ligase
MTRLVRQPSLAPAGPLNPVSMAQAFGYHVARDPDGPAVTCDGVTVSRGELDRRSNRLARALQEMGVVAGDFVAIALPNGIAFFETTFAVWKLGATPAPLSHRLPAAELQALVDTLKPRLLIGAPEGSVQGHLQTPPGFQPSADLSDTALPDIVPAHLKAIASGGSTGRPKVIVDAGRGVMDPLGTIAGMVVGDIVLNPGPLYHAAPFGLTHMALCWGGHVIQMTRFDPVEALALMETHRVRYAFFVPTMMHRIWRAMEQGATFRDDALEMVMHVAAMCPVWLKEKWIAWLGPDRIWEFYGGTEGIGATSITGREWLEHRGSVGRVAAGGELKIFDDADAECPAGEIGGVYFRSPNGPGATYRYLGAQAKRRGDWETFGDIGYLDADGYLYLSDRRTDLIICGGANVYPAEVEAALDAHPAVLSSAVVGLPDDDLGQRIHAIVQLDPARPAGVTAEGLSAFVAARLVRYKTPRTFEFVDWPLRDDAGKVRRTALRDARMT